MCSDPTHTAELKILSESSIRMETKLDGMLAMAQDHESRIRTAEAFVQIQGQVEKTRSDLDRRVDSVEATAGDNKKALDGMRRLMWAALTAAVAAVVMMVFEYIKFGVNPPGGS